MSAILQHSLFLLRKHWAMLLVTWVIAIVIGMIVMFVTTIGLMIVVAATAKNNLVGAESLGPPLWVSLVQGAEYACMFGLLGTTVIRSITHPNELGEKARKVAFRVMPRVGLLAIIMLSPFVSWMNASKSGGLPAALALVAATWALMLCLFPIATERSTWGVDEALELLGRTWKSTIPALIVATLALGVATFVIGMLGSTLLYRVAGLVGSMLMITTVIAAYQREYGEEFDAFASSPHVHTNAKPDQRVEQAEAATLAAGSFVCSATSGSVGGEWVELHHAGIFEIVATWDSPVTVKLDVALPDGRWFGLPVGEGQPLRRRIQINPGQYFIGAWQETPDVPPVQLAVEWRLLANEQTSAA